MFFRFAPIVLVAIAAFAPVAEAAGPRATDALLDALGLPETVLVMRQEGLDYGAELASDMLPTGGGVSWRKAVDRIYNVERMEETVRNGFAAAWADEHAELDAIEEFFGSEEGQEVVRLEISAREAMTAPGVEDAARAAWRARDGDTGDDDPRLALITEFIENNGLIDANVVGAMNSSFEFYAGLVAGGAFEMSEDEILSEVWGTEEASRKDTREWLFAYMILAYRPLDEEILSDYVELAASSDGKALNRALFAGFDRMYADISFALGLALAQQMSAQDL